MIGGQQQQIDAEAAELGGGRGDIGAARRLRCQPKKTLRLRLERNAAPTRNIDTRAVLRALAVQLPRTPRQSVPTHSPAAGARDSRVGERSLAGRVASG